MVRAGTEIATLVPYRNWNLLGARGWFRVCSEAELEPKPNYGPNWRQNPNWSRIGLEIRIRIETRIESELKPKSELGPKCLGDSR